MVAKWSAGRTIAPPVLFPRAFEQDKRCEAQGVAGWLQPGLPPQSMADCFSNSRLSPPLMLSPISAIPLSESQSKEVGACVLESGSYAELSFQEASAFTISRIFGRGISLPGWNPPGRDCLGGTERCERIVAQMQNKLYVGNLAADVAASTRQAPFKAHGFVMDAKVVAGREGGAPPGFAFLTMATDESARTAIQVDGARAEGAGAYAGVGGRS